MGTMNGWYKIVLVSILVITTQLNLSANEHFQWENNTGEYATVGILLDTEITVNGESLAPGDEIGVFNSDGLCVGGIVWCGEENHAITVWGNNIVTEEVDGMQAGENMHFRIWQKSTDTEFEVFEVDFEQGDGVYEPHGIYVISTLRAYDPVDAPALVYPENSASGLETTVAFRWNEKEHAVSYSFQLSDEPEFSELLVDEHGVTDTTYSFDGLGFGKKYYWRVRATNEADTSDWSHTRNFNTMFPVADVPDLVSPGNGAVDVPVETVLQWGEVEGSVTYEVQLSTKSDFNETIIDSTGITWTELEVNDLESDTEYFWRFRAKNGSGASDWSPTWNFTTQQVTSVEQFASDMPEDYSLEQNYPNPFNPTTTIRFALPEAGPVNLEVYNMLGQRVTTLIDGEHYSSGIYEKVWNAKDNMGRELSSGMYIYRITAGNYVSTKRMMLTK